MPLEEENDIRKLLSLNLTGAFVEEFRETDSKILSPLLGRIGRYPSVGVKPTWQGVILVSNPYPDGSAWHKIFEVMCPEGYVLYRQPSGLSSEAENVENLPEGYYQRLCEGATREFIDVAVHGLNGQDLSGAAVFRDVFDYWTHTVPDTQIWEGRQFLIGFDTDRNPAALIAQRTPTGQLVVHQEVFAEGMGIEAFFTSELTPVMYERYSGHAFVICDPSAVRRSSITEESQKDAIQRLGYDVALAPTNAIDSRLRAVETLFMTSNKGQPAIVLSRAGCPVTIEALMGSYKFPRSQRGEIKLTPEKTHPVSDVMDALQYLCLGFGSARTGRLVGRGRGVARNHGAVIRVPDRRGWT